MIMQLQCPEVWKRLHLLMRIVSVSTIVALCVTIIGFGSPIWVSRSIKYSFYDTQGVEVGKGYFQHLGLWQACGSGKGCVFLTNDLPAFYVATRVFGVLGFMSSIATTVLTAWFVIKSKGEAGRPMFLSMILSFLTGGLFTLTISIFGGYVEIYLSFAFTMMCIATIAYVANGVLFLVYISFL